MPEAGDQQAPEKHGKSLAGFYIAVGVVAALFGLGVWLHKPLRLAYAMHRVKAAQPGYPSNQASDGYVRELGICIQAAREGNRPAIEAVIAASWFSDYNMWRATGDPAYCAQYEVAASQPQAFFEVLDRQPDKLVRQCIWNIATSCESHSLGDPVDMICDSMGGYANSLGNCEAGHGKLGAVARATHDFLRRKYAGELAEWESEKARRAPRLFESWP